MGCQPRVCVESGELDDGICKVPGVTAGQPTMPNRSAAVGAVVNQGKPGAEGHRNRPGTSHETFLTMTLPEPGPSLLVHDGDTPMSELLRTTPRRKGRRLDKNARPQESASTKNT